MVRSSGWSSLAALAVFAVIAAAAACGPKTAATPADPNAGLSRGELEMELRQRLGRVEGDACAQESWLKQLIPTARGLQAEIAEELLAEQAFGCRQLKKPDGAAPGKQPDAVATADGKDKDPAAPADKDKPADKDRPALPPEPVSGACSRKRAEADLRAKSPNRTLNRAAVDVEFQRCYAARIASCQFALDADVEEGLACWKQDPWPEVPAAVKPEDVANTAMCLLELKAVIADLRKCRTKKPADRDACVAPYIGYAPQCPLLKAERVWKAFPGREDVERVAKADAQRRTDRDAKVNKEKADQETKEAKLKAEQEAKAAKLKAEQDAKKAAEDAKIARETERCSGRTTLEFAEKLKAQPGPRTVPGCKYQVVGRVVSKNNAFVQLVDPSGSLIFLLRTKEALADGEAIADRTASFDSIEEAELADGSKRSFAVFTLEPAPPKK